MTEPKTSEAITSTSLQPLNPHFIQVGPALSVKGGISACNQFYVDEGYWLKSHYFGSYCDGPMPKKFVYFGWFLIRYTAALLFNRSIQGVHIHMSDHGSMIRKSIALGLAKLFGKKTVVHIHGGNFINNYSRRYPKKVQQAISWMLTLPDVLLGLSESWVRDLSTICEHPHVEVLYNPALPQQQVTYAETPEINIVFMGRITRWKGIWDLIEAARLVRHPGIRIHLCGDGEMDKARELIKKYQLEDKIQFHTWVGGSEKDSLYRQASFVVLPTYFEGLPIGLLEALAYGLPIISTPVGGIPEMVEHGKNGFLFEPGNVDDLAKYMEVLANDATLRAEMGQIGYKLAQSRFQFERIARQLKCIYDTLVPPQA